MKKIIKIVFYIFTVVSMTGCARPLEPKKVRIDGVTYCEGFYDDSLLYMTRDITFQEGFDTVEKNTFHRLDLKKYDIVHSKEGRNREGQLYCAEEQWEKAKAYYEDSNNYDYYCQIGEKNGKITPGVTEIPDIDVEKLDKLLNFALKKSRNIFGVSKKEIHTILMTGEKESPTILFYKVSKDGLFTSNIGYKFYRENDKLVLLYGYGNGSYKAMEVLDIPEELSQYFLELVINIMNSQN